jgi:cytochrome c
MRLSPTLPMLAVFATALASSAHAADGARLFALQCKACHGAQSSVAGPSLNGTFGRKVAGAPGFSFSPALKAKGGTWTEASLDAYLAAPQAFAPGGRMAVAVAAPGDRAAVIDYLKTLK